MFKLTQLTLHTHFDKNNRLDVVSVGDQTGIINISLNTHGTSFDTKVLTDTGFGISSIISLAGVSADSPRFAIASNRNNSIQILSQDLIFMSGFE